MRNEDMLMFNQQPMVRQVAKLLMTELSYQSINAREAVWFATTLPRSPS